MNAQLKTVAVTVDPQRTIKAMQSAFTNRTRVVNELLQNAARSGATQVSISSGAGECVIEDDGSGIESFDALLGFASSAWNAEVMQRDTPFGIGFWSALYASEHIVVESRGLRLDASCDDLLAMHPVPLSPAPDRVGTRIAMKGFGRGSDCMPKLEEFAGYPLPIVLNGVPVERPHAASSGEWVDIGIGKLRFDIKRAMPGRLLAYLQGFPIHDSLRYAYEHGTGVIVHLDPQQFAGRLPDRAVLINADDALDRINAVVRDHARSVLVSLKAAMSPEAFVLEHGTAVLRWNVGDILDDLDILPGDQFHQIKDYPVITDADETYAPLPGVLSRDQLTTMGVFSDGETMVPVEKAYVALLGGFVCSPSLVRSLGSQHWLHGLLAAGAPFEQPEDQRAIEECSVAIRLVDPIAEIDCEVNGIVVPIHLARRLQLEGRKGTVEVPDHWGLALATYGEGAIFATPEASDDVVMQLSTHRDDNESLDYRAERDSRRSFARSLMVHANASPVALFKQALDDADVRWVIPNTCIGQTFLVTVDQDGSLQVKPA